MKKSRVVTTYGRHRQRVVAMETWASRDHVFSSSSDSFRSQQDNSGGRNDRNIFSSFCSNKENDSDISWLQEKTGGRLARKKQFHDVRASRKKPNRTNYCDSSVEIDKSHVSEERRRPTRAVMREKNAQAGKGARQDLPRGKAKKAKNNRESQAKRAGQGIHKGTPPSEDSGRTRVPSAYDFSDLDKYSLVISDSPPLGTCTSPSHKPTKHDRRHVLTSTPHVSSSQVSPPPHVSRSPDLRKSLLSHLCRAKPNGHSSTPKDNRSADCRTCSRCHSSTPKDSRSAGSRCHSSAPKDSRSANCRTSFLCHSSTPRDSRSAGSHACSRCHSSTPLTKDRSGLHVLNESSVLAVHDLHDVSHSSDRLSNVSHSSGRLGPMSRCSDRLGPKTRCSDRLGPRPLCSDKLDHLEHLSELSSIATSPNMTNSRDGFPEQDTCSLRDEITDCRVNLTRLSLSSLPRPKDPPIVGGNQSVEVIHQKISENNLEAMKATNSTRNKRSMDWSGDKGSMNWSGSVSGLRRSARLRQSQHQNSTTDSVDGSSRVARADDDDSPGTTSDDYETCPSSFEKRRSSGVGCFLQSAGVIAEASQLGSCADVGSCGRVHSSGGLASAGGGERTPYDLSRSLFDTSDGSMCDVRSNMGHFRHAMHMIIESSGGKMADSKTKLAGQGANAADGVSEEDLSDITEGSDEDFSYELTESGRKAHPHSDERSEGGAESDAAGPQNPVPHASTSDHSQQHSVSRTSGKCGSVRESRSELQLSELEEAEFSDCESDCSESDQSEQDSVGGSDVSEYYEASHSVVVIDDTDRLTDVAECDEESDGESDRSEDVFEEAYSDGSDNDTRYECVETSGYVYVEGEEHARNLKTREERSSNHSDDREGKEHTCDNDCSHTRAEHECDHRNGRDEEEHTQNHSYHCEIEERTGNHRNDLGERRAKNIDKEGVNAAMVTPATTSRHSTTLEQLCNSLKVLTPVRAGRSTQVMSARDKLLLRCGQAGPVPFSKCFTPAMFKKCVKIGEGVYGEVFKTERSKRSVALKVIPIEGDVEVNDERQKSFAEMLPEIVISKELSDLRHGTDYMTSNFVHVRGVSLVQGGYPSQLLRQWDQYNERKGSENDRPDMFTSEQLFVVFEFEESGSDLESFQFTSLAQAHSALLQVACTLAVAEGALQFEHRDLHWGNVLLKATRTTSVDYVLAGERFSVATCGIRVAIIDFTLSRLCKDGCAVFCDLSLDPTLFDGRGDYQFDVYRLMKEENENHWEPFRPYTNVLWLHYLADKLLKMKSYTQAQGREHSALSRHFRTFLREALAYSSALHLVKENPFFSDSLLL